MDVIRKENATGKMYLSGFDSQGRPVLVMRTRNENTHDYDGNLLHLVYQVKYRHVNQGSEVCLPFYAASRTPFTDERDRWRVEQSMRSDGAAGDRFMALDR